jgi:hypothetical protein
MEDNGSSADVREHGPNDVAVPHVPMTWCDVWPVAALSVRVEPEMVHVNQLTPVAEQDVAPDEEGGKTPNPWAMQCGASQEARIAMKRKRVNRAAAWLIIGSFCLTTVGYSYYLTMPIGDRPQSQSWASLRGGLVASDHEPKSLSRI